MDPRLGWALVVLVLIAGWQTYQWHGVALAATIIVFWLVLQFNRTLRVMKNAASAPIGYVESTPKLQAKLKPRMLLVAVVGLTGSLGQRSADSTDVDDKYTWFDETGRELTVSFHNGRCTRWYLHVPDEPADGVAVAVADVVEADHGMTHDAPATALIAPATPSERRPAE